MLKIGEIGEISFKLNTIFPLTLNFLHKTSNKGKLKLHFFLELKSPLKQLQKSILSISFNESLIWMMSGK